MANPSPPCVLLDRIVLFVEGKELTIGGWSWSRVQMVEEMEWRMAPAMKPVPFLADPPQVSSLQMLLPPEYSHLAGIGEISSIHNGIVVIYAHRYYLLYDASNNHLTAIPPLPDSLCSPTFLPLGRTAVVVTAGDDDDDYILADIVTSSTTGLPDAKLFVWSSSSEWAETPPVRLPLPPHLCGPIYFFHVDTAFSFQGSIFWVDLLKGILICDHVSSPEGPELVFVPLPHCRDVHGKPRHCFSPNEHRSIGCVSGAIKFVALISYGEEASCPENEVKLKIWALSPDFKHWKEETTLTVGDIWASESFNEIGLPHVMPIPILSVNEDGIMYAVLNDIFQEPIPDHVNEFGQVLGDRLVAKANYMIGFDILQNKVLSFTKISQHGELRWLTPYLIATDFSSYLQDHTRGEASAKDEQQLED
ncbi:uncharacterized protein LOC127760253 [Oryza glaberrima]|uniref:DUF1618 domain-containing protein n=2 Tax=Oryza TaxID=4527 RepID=A0A0D3EJ03_9ORYZ|nr:uncharacterized protein LOC127760253 [Oryza glaberrima]